ncbi:uncharacterized protein LOC141657463 [Silene latifolia]|uniref:uncharacterized protein LOC141657463 n=1 Tax=Silene latifolia TaxID=37657 RepID=UPI003D77999F
MGKKKKIVEEENETSKKIVSKVVSDDEESKRSKKKRKKNKTLEVEKESSIIIKPKVNPTFSIAIPASIIGNAQSLELATRLAGQIARAATIYRVDEIVVFDNNESSLEEPLNMSSSDENESNAAFFMRILRYLETPQYLRRALFPRHHNLRFAGLLPPLDAPHHFRKHEWGLYREGVTLGEKAPNSVGTLVDVGLSKNVVIDQVLGPGLRVTVAMGNDQSLSSGVLHQVVPSTTPKEEEGMYWGYKVRYAPNLSSVFENSTYENGYDYVIGTSEHGQTLKSSELCIPAFRHFLIAFGGLAGLEECIKEDKKLKGKDAREVFPTYLNLCPNQGSRTIRTEEAIFISLQYFQEPIGRALQKG